MQPENQTPSNPPVTSPSSPQKGRQITLPNLWQLVTLVLLIAIGIMLFMWRPWEPNIKASERTITVTGNATVTATPDEYVFSPSYRFTNADKQAALSAMTTKSNDIVSHLKSMGVASKDIQTNADNYGDGYYPSTTANGNTTYSLNLTITIDDATLAQKVQDYLLTTSPTGDITPYVSFSKSKEQQLQGQARSKAEQNAKAEADQSAKNLGFKVDKIKSVTDGTLGGNNLLYGGIASGANSATQSATPHLDLQPGQNDLPYSVQVTYYIH